jgi:hypothetical protein
VYLSNTYIRELTLHHNAHRAFHISVSILLSVKKKSKIIPVTGREGPYGCETFGLTYFLENQLIDGDEALSLTRRPPSVPQEVSWYSFLLGLPHTNCVKTSIKT